MQRSVCLAIIQKKKLLVVEKENKRNFWDLPGGEIETGELESDFIFNEIRKQIPGLNLESVEPYGYFNGKTLFRWKSLKSKIYLLKTNQIIRLGNPEVRKIKWISNVNVDDYRLSKKTKIVFYLLKDEGYL